MRETTIELTYLCCDYARYPVTAVDYEAGKVFPMAYLEITNQGGSRQANATAEVSSEVSSRELLQSPLPKDITAGQAYAAFFLGFGVAIALLALLRYRPELAKMAYQLLGRLKRRYLSPCRSCRFFSGNNSHLKCAVHPNQVLTGEAKHCPDYWPRHGSRFISNETSTTLQG